MMKGCVARLDRDRSGLDARAGCNDDGRRPDISRRLYVRSLRSMYERREAQKCLLGRRGLLKAELESLRQKGTPGAVRAV